MSAPVSPSSPASGGAGSSRPASAPPVPVVVVDDHAIFRSGLKADLDPARIQVIGEAADVGGAIETVRRLRPAVVLLDVHLPGGTGAGGAEVAAACQDLAPAVRFLAISVSDAAEDVVAVIRAGARGYVTKTVSGAEVTDAVQRIAGGDAVFSPRLAGFVLDAFGTAAASPSGAGSQDGAGAHDGAAEPGDEQMDLLSAREREVMRLIARGYTYREAARELFISERTVETHVSKVLRKLQLSNRHELTRWAGERGLL